MKIKIFITIPLILFLSNIGLCAEVTEDRFVEYTVQAQIIAQKYQNDPTKMLEELEKLNKEYDIESEEWQKFSEKVANDEKLSMEIAIKFQKRLEQLGYPKNKSK